MKNWHIALLVDYKRMLGTGVNPKYNLESVFLEKEGMEVRGLASGGW